MLVEKRVLRGERRIDQVLGNFAQRNDRALAAVGVVELPQELAFAIKDLRRLEAGVVADFTKRGQVAREHGVAGGSALEQNEDADQAYGDHAHEQARANHQRHAEFARGRDAVAVPARRLETVQALQARLSALLGTAANVQALGVAV